MILPGTDNLINQKNVSKLPSGPNNRPAQSGPVTRIISFYTESL